MTEQATSGQTRHFDVLVLGSGVAGLSAAVRLASDGTNRTVAIVTKGELSASATRWAQGGVAAVLGGDEDSTDLHLADTLKAGAGLCDLEAVRVLVDEGPARVRELIAMGAEFDREASGSLSLAREGGHSRARIVHAGGAATGLEVERALVEATHSSATAIFEHCFALDLVVEDNRCVGVQVVFHTGQVTQLRATHTVLATGGAGQLFAVTTNPHEATGDGVAMALRAGVCVADIEFMQFHPTALHHPAMPRPLLSEALRGHGALLRNSSGERFVDELAPRDVVSRAMAAEMERESSEHLWLDATGLDHFAERFPTIHASLSAIDLDPMTEWIPIAPAAHHLAGGVLVDLDGASSMPGLWAAGEVACSGVHGANRLASNSLLEGMVFGARLFEAIADGKEAPQPTGAMRAWLSGETDDIAVQRAHLSEMTTTSPASGTPTELREALQKAMTKGAGVVRSEASLAAAKTRTQQITGALVDHDPTDPAVIELTNLCTVAHALLDAAEQRTESRGNHVREEFPDQDPSWRKRQVFSS